MKWLNKGLACILASGLLLTAAGCSGRPQKPGSLRSGNIRHLPGFARGRRSV